MNEKREFIICYIVGVRRSLVPRCVGEWTKWSLSECSASCSFCMKYEMNAKVSCESVVKRKESMIIRFSPSIIKCLPCWSKCSWEWLDWGHHQSTTFGEVLGTWAGCLLKPFRREQTKRGMRMPQRRSTRSNEMAKRSWSCCSCSFDVCLCWWVCCQVKRAESCGGMTLDRYSRVTKGFKGIRGSRSRSDSRDLRWSPFCSDFWSTRSRVHFNGHFGCRHHNHCQTISTLRRKYIGLWDSKGISYI